MIFKESETVELKEIVVDDIKKEIIAFANTNGGKIYIGVGDSGDVMGIESPDKAILQITNMIRDSVKPDITMFVHYDVIDVNGKSIVVVDVQRGTGRPYYLSSKGLRPEGVYVRQGTSSAPATDTAIRMMIKDTDGESYEAKRCLNQELSFEQAESEFKKRGLEFDFSKQQTLKIVNSDKIYTNLGLILSDQCPHTIKIAVFSGDDQTAFKDRREFSGSVFEQLNKAYSFIDLNNQTKSTFEGLFRVDSRSYPEIAVREALLNSVVHRDYSFSSSINISIYSDRMEFVSIGGLLPGIEIDDILMGVSVCRNPHLANVFYRLQLIEAYGTGMKKIFGAYKNSKAKPAIEKSSNAFKLILPNLNTYKEETMDKDENEVVEFAKNNNGITRVDMEKIFGISTSTAYRMLKKMVMNGLLVAKGNAKNIKYYPL